MKIGIVKPVDGEILQKKHDELRGDHAITMTMTMAAACTHCCCVI